MTELLTILAIAFALEYLLGWAFNRKPSPEQEIDEPRRSPIINIQEILPREPGQRNFRVIADCSVSPIDMEPYLPFAYGDSLPDDLSRIATNVSYQREHQTKTHAVWHASYKFSCPYITSDGVGLSATEYAARLFSIGCLTADELRQAINLPQFPPMEDGCNV